MDHLIFASFILSMINETKNQFLYLLLSRHAVQIFSLKQTLTLGSEVCEVYTMLETALDYFFSALIAQLVKCPLSEREVVGSNLGCTIPKV